MTIWFFLWFLLAVAVLGYLGWSTNVTLSQRKGWIAFAGKYKLDVLKGRNWLSPVALTGAISGRRVNIYVDGEQGPGARIVAVHTHIEVFLNDVPRVGIIFSKRPLPASLAILELPETFRMTSPDWPTPAVAQTEDVPALTEWMNAQPTRVTAIKNFMTEANVPNTDAMFVCDREQAFLFLRTEDPMRDPRALNAIVQRMFGYAKALESSTANPNPENATPSPEMSA